MSKDKRYVVGWPDDGWLFDEYGGIEGDLVTPFEKAKKAKALIDANDPDGVSTTIHKLVKVNPETGEEDE
jgi:hypothetical protein